MKHILETFKDKMMNEEIVIGPFMKTSDPAFVEIAGHSGFDFVILDMEHGPSSLENMQNLIRAANSTKIVPIVRVASTNEEGLSKVLDIGAMGIQVPQITNAEEAKKVIRYSKFHPKGERGVCRFVRAANYSSQDQLEYFKEANESLIILQLEGKEAIDNIDEILGVDGIDILFIGPYDLSQSLGYPGDISNPIVIEKMEYIVNKAKEANMFVGTFVDKIEDIKRWKDAGIKYISYSVDVGIFMEACQSIVKSSVE